ncbi:MAG: TetR family transcriptional regulator [Chitinivibrionales bacterium]|nr:TetR family transcriptional regulator [Chitinivibrionales bacterium]
MDPKLTRQQAIREAKQNLILDAARELFSCKGYHETGLEDIAARAGFSKAALYSYFADKEDIFLHLALRELDTLQSKMCQCQNENQPPFVNLECMIKAVFETFGEHFSLLLQLSNFSIAAIHTQSKRQQMHKHYALRLRGMLHEFTGAFAACRKLGKIHTSVSDENCARYLSGMIKSVFLKWRLEEKVGDVEKEIDSIMHFITSGVAGDPR